MNEEVHVRARLGQIGALGFRSAAGEDENGIGIAADGVEAGLNVFNEGWCFAGLEGGD